MVKVQWRKVVGIEKRGKGALQGFAILVRLYVYWQQRSSTHAGVEEKDYLAFGVARSNTLVSYRVGAYNSLPLQPHHA